MTLEVGKDYLTSCGLRAQVTYRLPEDVEDAFPFVGFCYFIDGEETRKFGQCWNAAGFSSDSNAYSIYQEVST